MHLLLTPQRVDSAALLMKHLGQRYVQYINHSYRRSGKRGGQPCAELSAFGDHRTRQARPGVAGGLGFVVVRVAVNNQAPAHDVADTTANRDAAGLKAEPGHAAGVGLQGCGSTYDEHGTTDSLDHLFRDRAEQQGFGGCQAPRTDDDAAAAEGPSEFDDVRRGFAHQHMKPPPEPIGIEHDAGVHAGCPAAPRHGCGTV